MESTVNTNIGRTGLLTVRLQAAKLRAARVVADRQWIERDGKRLRFARFRTLRETDTLVFQHHNAYVLTGLNNALNREFGVGGTAVGYIGVDNNATTVTSATTFLHGAAAGAAANQVIKAFNPAPTATSTATVTAGATFANADFTAGVFVINKVGLLTAATDTGSALVDVIGGTGGTAPYARTFSMDLTAVGTFSFTMQIAVTASAI